MFAPHITPTPLPIFQGLDGDGGRERFVEAARRTTTAFRLPPAVAAEWVISFLSGPAREEVLSRPLEERDTGDKVLGVLAATFQTISNAIDSNRRFYLRRQGVDESLLVYAQSLASLAAQANRARKDAVPAWALSERFVDGVASNQLRGHLKGHLRNQRDITFTALRDEARRWTRENPDSYVEQVTATQVEELRATVATLSAQIAEGRRQPLAPETPLPPQTRPTDRHARYHCQWCNRSGHVEADCYSKRKYLQHHPTWPETRATPERDTWRATPERDPWPETPANQPRGPRPRHNDMAGDQARFTNRRMAGRSGRPSNQGNY